MKNFFKKLFGDKYPERARKKNRIECVYAGPEQMARRFNRMEKVYAGPPTRDKDDNNAMEDVYAGPDPEVGPEDPDTVPEKTIPESKRAKLEELMKDRRQFETVYAGPSTLPPSEMMAVYAGPMQMQQSNPIGFVYAGPAQMQQQSPMMLVYAGPGQFPKPAPVDNGPKAIGGDAMRGKTPEQIVREGHCHICGEPVKETQKFCTNCGTPLPRNTTPRTERA